MFVRDHGLVVGQAKSYIRTITYLVIGVTSFASSDVMGWRRLLHRTERVRWPGEVDTSGRRGDPGQSGIEGR
jgi:hypothetical protein